VILKRWALNLLSMGLGLWIGLVVVQYLSQRMSVPAPAQLLFVMLIATTCFLIGYGLGLEMFPRSPEEVIRPEVPKKLWAWLRPRGEGLRSGFPINKSNVIIGRDIGCDVLVNHHSVSRRHAEVVRLAEGYLFRDMGSKNGCFVNGQRVQEYLLQDGDVVAVGDIQLNFEAPRKAEPAEFQDAEHLSVSQLLSPEALPLEGGLTGSPPLEEDEGTEVWRRPD
jgi:hypothetical protein